MVGNGKALQLMSLLPQIEHSRLLITFFISLNFVGARLFVREIYCGESIYFRFTALNFSMNSLTAEYNHYFYHLLRIFFNPEIYKKIQYDKKISSYVFSAWHKNL